MSYWGDFVVPTALATSADYAAWTGASAPANINAILRACTALVLDATAGSFYVVDATTGLATDAIVLKAMNDATCIQAAAWVALGVDPTLGGIPTATVETSKKIGTAAITYDSTGAANASTARQLALTSLVPDAVRRLNQVNLTGASTYVL